MKKKEEIPMEFEKLIQQRRSVRAYKEETVSKELLEKVLRQAQMAPSWKNSQTARVYTANEGEKLQQIREALPAFNRKSSDYAALIVTTFLMKVSGHTNAAADNDGGDFWGAYDLGLHDAYLILAAKDNGLDTLIMGLRDEAKLKEVLNIPDNEQIMSVIAIGYADQTPALRPRKDLAETAVIF